MGFKIIIQVASESSGANVSIEKRLASIIHHFVMSVESVSSVVRLVRIVLHVRLLDDGVLIIVRVVLGVLVAFRDVVVEGWESWSSWAANVWPLPSVCHWLLILEDWVALINES